MTSLNKRITETSIDRLGALPDCLIIHILSFLEVKQSAITTLLSKRWQFLWTQSPRLIFREKIFWIHEPDIQDFVTRVNRTLVICGRNDLDTFEVKFPYSESNSPDVKAWVGFALKNKAKQVSLLLYYDYVYYRLPQTMFQSAYLKRLKLWGCIVAPLGTIERPSLTELHIKESELQQHVMEKMLSGCLILRCLVLKGYWGLSRLEVSSKSLYELRVSDPIEGDINENEGLQISAPYLHTLWVSLHPDCRKLSLENTSSLVRATIDFAGTDWDDVKMMSNAKEILEKIRHVKVVDLRFAYIEVLSSSCLAINDCRFPQSARTCLSVQCSIHVLVGLLESSPNLEALVIEGSYIVGDPHTCIDSKLGLDCDLLHLKSIVIKDFTGSNLAGEPMLTLARILLNKAPALEMMVVHNRRFTSSSRFAGTESFKIAQKLPSYPRSSKAVVLLN